MGKICWFLSTTFTVFEKNRNTCSVFVGFSTLRVVHLTSGKKKGIYTFKISLTTKVNWFFLELHYIPTLPSMLHRHLRSWGYIWHQLKKLPNPDFFTHSESGPTLFFPACHVKTHVLCDTCGIIIPIVYCFEMNNVF